MPHLYKNLNIFPDEKKSIFSKPKIWLVQLKEGFWFSSVKIYSNWWSQTPDHDCKLVQNCKLFCSSIKLIWYVQWSFWLSFFVQTSLRSVWNWKQVSKSYFTTYHLPLARSMIAKNDSFSLFIYKYTWS